MPCHRVLPGITAMADMSEFLVETADQVLDGQPRGADGIAALSLAEQQNGYLSNRFLSKKGCWSNHFFEYLVSQLVIVQLIHLLSYLCSAAKTAIFTLGFKIGHQFTVWRRIYVFQNLIRHADQGSEFPLRCGPGCMFIT